MLPFPACFFVPALRRLPPPFAAFPRPPQLTGLQVLHELDLDDADDPRETVLYRLSLSPGLERFR